MKAVRMKLSELVMDFSIYPRASLDSQHVSYLREADDAGFKLPPVVVEAKSKRIVDGFHRVKMYRAHYGDDYEIEVLLKSYPNDRELLLDSIRYNAHHGRTLSRYDRTHCITLAAEMKIPEAELASALSIRVEKIGELRVGRTGELKIGNTIKTIALKRTIGHMAGLRLNKGQQEVNERLGGMNQVFYVNQIIMLIQSGLLNTADENLMAKIADLRRLLDGLKQLKHIG